jgi:hypothetical protein
MRLSLGVFHETQYYTINNIFAQIPVSRVIRIGGKMCKLDAKFHLYHYVKNVLHYVVIDVLGVKLVAREKELWIKYEGE